MRLGFGEGERRSGEERYGGEPVRRGTDHRLDVVHPIEGVYQAINDLLASLEAIPLLLLVLAEHRRPLIRPKPPDCGWFPGRDASEFRLESCLPP